MEKEYVIEKSTTITVNVVANKPESLRKVVEKTSTVRAYDNGYIGVAGAIGNADFLELEKVAIDNLNNKIPYPSNLPENNVDSFDSRKDIINVNNFMGFTKDLIGKLVEAEPEFILSNKIYYSENEKSYKNTKGSNLFYAGNELAIVLIVKDRLSANIMDFALVVDTNDYDEKKIIESYKLLCSNFRKNVDIKDGEYKIVTDINTISAPLLSHLSGEMYFAQASLFKNQLNEKIFNDKFSLLFNREKTKPNTSFFDIEGEIAKDYKSYLIRDGIFERIVANKKVASDYNLPRAENSDASYDGIPNVCFSALEIEPTKKSVAKLLDGDDGIYVVEASGGDMTTSGDFASPVQCAYLIRDGKLAGKLPTLNLAGNIKDYFGDKFVGATYDGPLSTNDQEYVVTKMNITHIE